MQFNQVALDTKIKHLDEIKKYPDLLDQVIERNIKGNYRILEQSRRWTGGGSTPYVIETDQGKLFLKVKHKDVIVESKLEEESCFIEESCVLHEKIMMEKACNAGVSTPKIVFYDEQSGFQFLATEFIPNSFDETLESASLEEILDIWKDLLRNVLLLFENGIVHSDIHEFNIRLANKQIVLIDFEEARDLKQYCSFNKSLDYTGKNSQSTLGEFPLANNQDYTVKYNSLLRMRQVFRKYLIPKVSEYIKECNYDSSNGICIAIDHGHSDLTYQSILNKWINVKGQREQMDNRPKLLWSIMKQLVNCDEYTLVDVGSNNGLFCREISKYSEGEVRCIGLEGFHNFNILADALAIIEDCDNVEYYDFICGQDDMDCLNITNHCFMTICSVWHHIQEKASFIEQINKLDVKHILLEMPVQEECYEGRTWEAEVQRIKEVLGFRGEIVLGNSNDYQRPLVLLSKENIGSKLEQRLTIIAKQILNPGLINRLIAKIRKQ